MATATDPPSPSLAAATGALTITGAAIGVLADRCAASLEAATSLVLGRHGRVVVSGIGKSGHIGAKIAATLASTGTAAGFVHATEALHGDSGMVGDGDTLLAISHSGTTAEVQAFAALVTDRGIPVISMTGCGGSSPLATAAHVAIDASVERECDEFDLVPSASTSVCLALGDALAVGLMAERGFGPADFARFHPGGALGQRLDVG